MGEWLRRWAGVCAVIPTVIYVLLAVLYPAAFTREADSHLFNAVGYTLLATGFTFLVAYILLHANSGLSRALSSRVLVFTGTVSYGLYLYHEPLQHVLIHGTHLGDRGVFPFTLGVGLLVSWISFRIFEKPIVDWGHRLASRLAGGTPEARLRRAPERAA
jgi:peptidoglycan/LPS O-acetylase OafA/YrhL